MKIFGKRIRRLRIKRGWSQEYLGLRAGLHRTYIGSIERSERNISLLNIQRIAHALHLPLQLLVVEENTLGMNSGCGKGELCPGMHVGSIYRGKEEQLLVMMQFILDALRRKEKCVCVLTEDTKNRIVKELERRKISVEKCSQWGQFILLSHEETYLKEGCFHSEKMVKTLKNLHQAALREGFDGLRATGEITSGLVDFIGHKNFIEYEARLNYFYPDTRALGLCQYDEAVFSKEFLLNVIYTHPKIFLTGRLRDNPFYKHPAIFLNSGNHKNPADTYDFIKTELLKKH